MAKKKLQLDREAFMDWFFDYETRKTFFDDHNVMDALSNDGVFKINAKDLIANCGFLPANVVAEGQEPILDEWDEVDIMAYDTITFAKTEKTNAI